MTDTAAYKPEVADVAALVPSRAKGQYGRLTTFDSTTQPTGDQVQSIIDRAVAKIASKVGTPPAELAADAKEIVALRAAMLVELTYFGDQITAGRSPFNELKALYEEAVTDYLTDRSQLGADQEAGTADDDSPIWSFPPVTGGVDGFYTVPTPDAECPIDPIQGPIW